MREHSSQHISRQFEHDLGALHAKVMDMGGAVEEQLKNALHALSSSNTEIAKKVLNDEKKINFLEISIDQESVQILACQQPAASDLRLVMAITKTITDLERIGDEAEKIARMSIELADQNSPKAYYTGINTMGVYLISTVHDGLNAFARLDSRSALEVASREPKIDNQYIATLRQLITYMMEDPRNITAALDAIWVARALERIGDHIKNICEYIIYFVKGKDVRHISMEDLEDHIKTNG